MPRTNIAPQRLKHGFKGPFAADSLDVTLTAADATNKNMSSAEALNILLARNTSGTTAYTVTITTVPDEYGRTGDISAYSLGAGEIMAIALPKENYAQRTGDDSGKIYYEANNAEVQFGFFHLP